MRIKGRKKTNKQTKKSLQLLSVTEMNSPVLKNITKTNISGLFNLAHVKVTDAIIIH